MMKAGWAATLLALVMALHRDRPRDRWRLAADPRWVDLLSHRRNRVAGFRLVPVQGAPARRLDIHRPVRGQRHLGLRGVARQRLGDGAVAGRAAGAVDRRAAGDADADSRRQPVENGGRRNRARYRVRRGELRDPGRDGGHGDCRAPRAELARNGRPLGDARRRRLAGLWRHRGRVAVLAADADHRRQCRQAAQGLGGAHRRAPDQPRLCEALRDREHAAEGRRSTLYLHREERDRRARRGDRKADVAGRSARSRQVDSLHDCVPRAGLLPNPRRDRRDAMRRAGSSRGRSIRG